jgi:AraC-like DNA-binding protein
MQSTVPKFVFERPASADGEAFELFRASSLPHFTISLRDPSEAAAFSVHAVTYPMPNMILTRVRGGAMIMRRGPEEIASDPNPPLLTMHVQLAGNSDGTVGNRTLKTRPGDVLFYDYARGLTCTNTAFECITLLIARDRAHPAFLHRAAHGAKLTAGTGPARLVSAVAEAVHTNLDQLTMTQADIALQSLCDLAGRALEEHLASAAAEGEPLTSLNAALTFIDGRLDSDALSSADVAAHLALSRSALYRLFQSFGGVDNAIRQRRLDRAMSAILAGNGDERRKTRAGFNNEEQFARAFEKRFGARPARYTAMVKSKDADWLAAQSRRMGYETLEAWIEDLEGRQNTT